MRKKLLTILLAGTVLLSFAGCGNKDVTVSREQPKNGEKKVVRIGIANSGNFLGDISGIAQEKGYIEEELGKVGYKPEYVSFAAAGPAINEAFVSKNLDFANYGDLPPIVLKSKGINISIIGITNSAFNMDLVVQKDSPINSVDDIKGKKIIVGRGTVYQNFFNNLIKANNIQESSVEIINAVADAQSTFLAKKADGIAITDAYAKMFVASGKGKIIESTLNHPEWADQTVFAGRTEFIKSNPEVAVALLKAHIRARDYAKGNTDDTYKILSKSGIPEASIKDAYSYDGGKFNFYALEITKDSIDKLKRLNNFLVEQNLTTSSVKIEDLVDNSYYQKALKELKK